MKPALKRRGNEMYFKGIKLLRRCPKSHLKMLFQAFSLSVVIIGNEIVSQKISSLSTPPLVLISLLCPFPVISLLFLPSFLPPLFFSFSSTIPVSESNCLGALARGLLDLLVISGFRKPARFIISNEISPSTNCSSLFQHLKAPTNCPVALSGSMIYKSFPLGHFIY